MPSNSEIQDPLRNREEQFMPSFGDADNVKFQERIPGTGGSPGLKVSEVITTPAGAQIRIVQLSKHSAAIVAAALPPGVDEMHTVISVPEGSDVTTIAMSWSGFWDTLGDYVEKGAKLIAGGCKTVVHQHVTYNDNGIMTGSTTDFSLDCTGGA
jgi:hypothetical protein